MRKLLPLLLPLLLCTCGLATEDELAESTFFDLAGYMTAEAERLSGSPLTVEKTITLNGVTETQELTTLNYDDDLRLFGNADINKPAWRDKYRTEKEQLSGSHEVIRYVALDSALTTRVLEVESDRGEPTRIQIERRTGTVLSDGRSQLVYEPATGYSVVSYQKNRFGDDVAANVTVRWK